MCMIEGLVCLITHETWLFLTCDHQRGGNHAYLKCCLKNLAPPTWNDYMCMPAISLYSCICSVHHPWAPASTRMWNMRSKWKLGFVQVSWDRIDHRNKKKQKKPNLVFVVQILDAGLKPILCVGETKDEYTANLNKAVCAMQVCCFVFQWSLSLSCKIKCMWVQL